MKIENSQGHVKAQAQVAMREAIQNIAVGPDRGRDITSESASTVMRAILSGEIDEVQTAVFLIALRMKRESMPEFHGLYDALANHCMRAPAQVDDVICLADPFDGYSRTITMTPFIAPALAACGLNAVMHGVESVGPKHGVTAHKVYRLAGMDCSHSPAEAATRLEIAGCTYVDQRKYAASLFHLQSLRDRIVKRTALTTLERLLIPIRGRRATHLVLGYVHQAYPEIYARVAEQAGYQSILLLKGVEGGLAPALNKPLRRFWMRCPLPEDVGSIKEVIDLQDTITNDSSSAALPNNGGASPEQCLETGLGVMAGRSGTARNSLSLAAGQILFAHDNALSLAQAVEKVQVGLDNGAAKSHFDAMIDNRSAS